MPASKAGKRGRSETPGLLNFLQTLRQGLRPHLIVAHGSDDYLARQLIDELARHLGTPAEPCEVEQVSGWSRVGTVIARLATPMLWAATQLVVWDAGREKGEGPRKDDVEALQAAWGPDSPAVLCILLTNPPRATSALAKWAAVDATQVSLEPLTGSERARWISARCRRLELELAPEVARQLAEGTCPMGDLARDLEKLALSVEPGEVVGPQLLQALTQSSVETAIWDLTDALAAGQAGQAMEVLARQRPQLDSPFALLGPWISTERTMLRVAAAASPEQLTGIPPFLVKKTRQRLQRRPAAVLRHRLQQLAQIDRELKLSVLQEWTRTEHLMLSLCVKQRRGR